MATIKDISKRCGVSPATVSKALNGYGDISEETKQAGINLFRDTWMEYLHCSVSDAFGRIDEAYFSKDSKEKFVLQSIEDSGRNPEEIKVAIALHNAFRDVMSLGPAMIWPYPINVGLSNDGVVKITHIGIR